MIFELSILFHLVSEHLPNIGWSGNKRACSHLNFYKIAFPYRYIIIPPPKSNKITSEIYPVKQLSWSLRGICALDLSP